MILSKSGLPAGTVRLVMKRTPDKKQYRYHISNAPVSTGLRGSAESDGLSDNVSERRRQSRDRITTE
ncbi:MAG: hypothetical protein BWK80_53495 [Desulfobacteraceae bacterium IS3]|nr:MAG: hypothetical protein BWK80_53495 [Desulfobacteraceae bacterium IS3]